MAHTRKRSSSGFARGPRRLTSWSIGPGHDGLLSGDVTAFSTSTAQIIGAGVIPVIPALTIVRIHGSLLLSLTAADAQRSGFQFVAGIGVASLDAFTAGAASLPDPFDDTDWPGWMWQFSADLRTAVGAIAVGDPSVNPMRVVVESKSMRKLRINEVLFLSVQAGETGTSTMDVRAYTRVLAKLP